MNLDGLPPVGGLVESSLVHWEGRVAAVLYLQGCNLRCPACPVPHLVPGAEERAGLGSIPVEGVLDALFTRRHLLDGVVFAGGEPTLHEHLADLLEIVRSFGLKTRLHTNGTRPRAVRELLAAGLVDSVRLDLQAPLTALYNVAAGMDVDLGGIYRTVELLLGDPGDHEFRMVVDPRLLAREDVERLGRTVAGARRLSLAPVAPGLPGRRPLRALARVAGRFVEHCHVAGEPSRDYGRGGRGQRGRRSMGAA